MSLVEYDRVSDARAEFRRVLDSAARGTPVALRREDQRFAVVDAERLRSFLGQINVRPQLVSEDGGWSILFHGLPLAAEGETIENAIEDAVVVLREYAEDWTERLRSASNHADNWGLVQLVALSTDDELRDWLTGSE